MINVALGIEAPFFHTDPHTVCRGLPGSAITVSNAMAVLERAAACALLLSFLHFVRGGNHGRICHGKEKVFPRFPTLMKSIPGNQVDNNPRQSQGRTLVR